MSVKPSDNFETLSLTPRIEAQIEQRRLGNRSYVFHGGALCSRCLNAPPRNPDCYCGPCRAEIQRDYRANKKLADRERV